ncbi:MAG: YbaK/EbsC family protein [Candidatus Aenigmarchaeota archaeon]|nr:YbaK/EbsC family protein [Candidatus Aenigmarchaeota archaeon]
MESIEYLKNMNAEFRIIHLSEIPKTTRDVERLYGCPLQQVLKTLVFVGDNPVIAVLPGDRKASLSKLNEITKQNNLRIAKPDEVLRITGYSVGGVTPFCIKNKAEKIMDKGVFKNKTVNIGSGKAEIGIELKTEKLKEIWDGIIADISE